VVKIQFPKELFSEAFYDYLFHVRSPIELSFGGAGSGKTAHGMIKNALRMIGAPKYELKGRWKNKKTWTQDKPKNILAIRQVYGTLEDSVYTDMKKAVAILGFEDHFDFKKSPLKITCTATNKVMLFRGLDNVEKIKGISVENGSIDHFDVEEITETQEASINQLNFRTRGGGEYIDREKRDKLRGMIEKKTTLEDLSSTEFKFDIFEALGFKDKEDFLNSNKTMAGRFNPVNKGHWICNRFFTDSDGNTIFRIEDGVLNTPELYIHHSTHWDNPFLTVDDHIKYESFKFINEYFYNVYCLGRWGVLGDLIFSKVKLAEFDAGFIRNIPEMFVGMDFGDKPDPNALIRTGINRDKKEIYIIDESIEGELNSVKRAEYVKRFLMYDNEKIYADSAGSSEIRDLRELHNVNIDPVHKYGRVKGEFKSHGIGVLWEYTIFVSIRCKTFLNEISEYCWKKDSQGRATGIPDDGIGMKHQNTLDAGLFYALNSVLMRAQTSKIYG